MLSRRVALLLFAFLWAGCDDKAPPVPLPDGGRQDAGGGTPRDAGPEPDSATRDEDSGMEEPTPEPVSCSVDPADLHKLGDDRVGDREVALAAFGSTFGAAFVARPDDEVLARVHAIAFSSSGELGVRHRLSHAGTTRRPVALTPVQGGWLAAWVDNEPDGYEVRTLALAADLSPASSIRTVTATAAGEDLPRLFVANDRVWLAWVEDDMEGSRLAWMVEVNAEGAPIGNRVSSLEHRPDALVGGELAEGPVLLYASGVEGAQGPENRVFLQPLSAEGQIRGEPSRIDVTGIADGTLDAALGPSGGAVVYGVLVGGVRREVRFRAVSGDGTLPRDPRVLAEGSDASIAKFAGGYAVSYRAPASGGAPAEVRLLLVDELGEAVSEMSVAEAMPEGGRTTLRVSGAGQIAIAWADTTADGTQLLIARASCGGGT